MTDSPRENRAVLSQSLLPLSLRNKLFLFAGALVLVPGLALAFLSERRATQALERVVGRELSREAEHTADRLANRLRGEWETLASFAHQDVMREIRVADVDKRVSLALRTLRDGDASRLAYEVVDSAGAVVASSDPRRVGARSEPVARGGGGLRGPLPDASKGSLQLVMATPIPDPDDPERTLGELVALLDWGRLTDVTRIVRSELAAHGVAADIIVCGATGETLAGALSPHSKRSLAAIAAAARGSPTGGSDSIVDARAGLILGRATLGREFPQFRVLVVEPREGALAPSRALRERLLLATGLALAAALGLAALGAGRVVRPLSELTAALGGLTRGPATPRPVPVRSDDEIGALALAFNRMAEDLGRAQRDLVDAERFALVGELASGVAHEIRTSLGVLHSAVQLLERSLPERADARLSELALMVREEVDRLGRVVSDLLTLQRGRPLRLEPALVSQPLARALELVRPQAEAKGIRLASRDAPSPEPRVECEPELIQQVAVNLLVNATQALGEGGRIDVGVLDAEGGYGGFEVRDDGPGIPDGLRERIFAPFVTGRPGGVGLGLTFVKRVIHDHRGRVDLHTRPGAGTRVCIRLPLAEVAP